VKAARVAPSLMSPSFTSRPRNWARDDEGRRGTTLCLHQSFTRNESDSLLCASTQRSAVEGWIGLRGLLSAAPEGGQVLILWFVLPFEAGRRSSHDYLGCAGNAGEVVARSLTSAGNTGLVMSSVRGGPGLRREFANDRHLARCRHQRFICRKIDPLLPRRA
jgi:hypothetical protein